MLLPFHILQGARRDFFQTKEVHSAVLGVETSQDEEPTLALLLGRGVAVPLRWSDVGSEGFLDVHFIEIAKEEVSKDWWHFFSDLALDSDASEDHDGAVVEELHLVEVARIGVVALEVEGAPDEGVHIENVERVVLHSIVI